MTFEEIVQIEVREERIPHNQSGERDRRKGQKADKPAGRRRTVRQTTNAADNNEKHYKNIKHAGDLPWYIQIKESFY